MQANYIENQQHLLVVSQDLTEIPASLGEEYGNRTKRLDLSYNQLSRTQNLEKFTVLDSLILDYNSIEGDPGFPTINSLRTLSLNSNNITDLHSILPAIGRAFPNLTFLSMLKNPACPNFFMGKDQEEYQRYRIFVVFNVPKLNFLDSSPVTEWERNEAKRVGKIVGQVARPAEEQYKKEVQPDPELESIKALPSDLRSVERPGGASFGVSKYVYYGRQSEGNRFILNSDL